jgi:hypothetical protein
MNPLPSRVFVMLEHLPMWLDPRIKRDCSTSLKARAVIRYAQGLALEYPVKEGVVHVIPVRFHTVTAQREGYKGGPSTTEKAEILHVKVKGPGERKFRHFLAVEPFKAVPFNPRRKLPDILLSAPTLDPNPPKYEPPRKIPYWEQRGYYDDSERTA